MVMNSLSFIIFLPFVVVVNFILPRKYRYLWLFAASCFFYLYTDIRYAAGPAVCILTTYAAARMIQNKRKGIQKIVLLTCIGVNIIMLAMFRYTFLRNIFVPIGLSFYSLQAIGYLIDVYRGAVEPEKNPVRYAVYVIFFPTVMSGPIQRAPVLLKQIAEGREFDYTKARSGLYYLLWGYLLKIVMANQMGGMVDYAYGNYSAMPGATLLWATVLYAVQLYCDFAGYSSLAIGVSKILGFDIGENFEQPYFSASIKEFWGRWHISLSSWLRDYVYIPAGGNRKGRICKYRNLMITFLVSGLWHGTGLNFLIWGVLHGLYQVVADLLPGGKSRKTALQRVLGAGITFLLVDFAWLFFRAETLTQALDILKRIIFHFEFKNMTYYGSYMLGGTKWNLLMMLIGIFFLFLVDFAHEKKVQIAQAAQQKVCIVFRWTGYVILTLLILYVIVYNYGQSAATFIYTRF